MEMLKPIVRDLGVVTLILDTTESIRVKFFGSFFQQNAHIDFPHPPGVRRGEVRHQNSSEMSEQIKA